MCTALYVSTALSYDLRLIQQSSPNLNTAPIHTSSYVMQGCLSSYGISVSVFLWFLWCKYTVCLTQEHLVELILSAFKWKLAKGCVKSVCIH